MKIEIDGLICPSCKGTKLYGLKNSDVNPTSIICKKCSYKMEDGTKSLSELISSWTEKE